MTSTRMNGEISPAVVALLEADNSLPTFGIRVKAANDGRAVLVADVAAEFTNGLGIAHGGLIFALADTALAFAANSVLPGTVTAESSITYLAPVRAGQKLIADAVVESVNGRHTMVAVTVRVDDTIVAEFRGRGTARRRES